MKDAMKTAMQSETVKKHGKEASKFIPKVVKERIFPVDIDEKKVLTEAQPFISKVIGLTIEIDAEYDPQHKKKVAIPGKPGIYIE